MIVKRVNLTGHGICLFVGSLEATVLYALWDINDTVTMAQLYRYLIREQKTETAYSTIITTCNRMATKKLIQRIERDNSTPLWYKAFVDEQHFVETCMIDTLNVLSSNYSEQFLGYIGV